jgi:hypothetical protein
VPQGVLKTPKWTLTSSRPLFIGDSSVDQLVEIISVVAALTIDDLEGMKIDSSSPLADLVILQKSITRSLPTFDERLRVKMGRFVDDTVVRLLQNTFKYIPTERWAPEQVVNFIEWNFN